MKIFISIKPIDTYQYLCYTKHIEANSYLKVSTPMQYEIRETTATNDPADRGTLLAYAATFREAQAKAAVYAAAGRTVSVCRAT